MQALSEYIATKDGHPSSTLSVADTLAHSASAATTGAASKAKLGGQHVLDTASTVFSAESVASPWWGPWLAPSDVAALLCVGFAVAADSGPVAVEKGKGKPGDATGKAGGKAGGAEVAQVVPAVAFDTVPILPVRTTVYTLVEGPWPERWGWPPLQLAAAAADGMAPSPVAAGGKDVHSAKKPVTAPVSKAKKENDGAPTSPRANLLAFPPPLSESPADTALAAMDARRRGLRLLSALLGQHDADFANAQVASMLARIVVDVASIVAAPSRACEREALKPRSSPRAASAAATATPAGGRRTSSATGADAAAALAALAASTAQVQAEEKYPLTQPTRTKLMESLVEASLAMSAILPFSSKAVEELSALGPILVDSMLMLAVPWITVQGQLPWLSEQMDSLFDHAHMDDATALELRRLNTVVAVPCQRTDPRCGAHTTGRRGNGATATIAAPPDVLPVSVDVREAVLEVLQRAALCDALFRTFDASAPATPLPSLPAPDASDVSVAALAPTTGRDGKKPAAASAPVPAKDAKKVGKAGAVKDVVVTEVLPSVQVATLLKPSMSSTAGTAVVGVDWDCKVSFAASVMRAYRIVCVVFLRVFDVAQQPHSCRCKPLGLVFMQCLHALNYLLCGRNAVFNNASSVVQTDSVGARIGSSLLRHVPLLLHACGAHELQQTSCTSVEDANDACRLRRGVLRVLASAFSVYRARDKLTLEQLRLLHEWRFASAIASQRAKQAEEKGTALSEDSTHWMAVRDRMAASRSPTSGVFVYGTHATLVLGGVRGSYATSEEPDAGLSAPKKAGAVAVASAPTGKGKGEASVGVSEDPFVGKRSLLHPVEVWFGGPGSDALLTTPPGKLPSAHFLEKTLCGGTGYTATGALAHASLFWATYCLDGVAEVVTGRDSKAATKPATASGKRAAAATLTVASEGKEELEEVTITVSETPFLPTRIWVPSTDVYEKCVEVGREVRGAADKPPADATAAPLVKSSVLPVDDSLRALTRACAGEMRGLELQSTYASLSPFISDVVATHMYGSTALAVAKQLLELVAFETDALVTDGTLCMCSLSLD